jgi:glutamate transport system substrate-binding protein
MLSDGEIDALSTDDLILAGYAAAAENPSEFRILATPISDERYGVGLPKGDLDACEEVNRAITTMYQDGTAAELLERWFGASSMELVQTVPQFEGCS